MTLTQERLKEVLYYDIDTGIFKWKFNRRGVTKDQEAGCTDDGYITIGIDKEKYYAHRLVWLYMYGYLPKKDIHHKDENPSNNRLNNLECLDRFFHVRKNSLRSDNQSGVKGVNWSKHANMWRVNIGLNGKTKSFGYFKDFDEAVCHRLAAEQRLDWYGYNKQASAYRYVLDNIVNKYKDEKEC